MIMLLLKTKALSVKWLQFQNGNSETSLIRKRELCKHSTNSVHLGHPYLS